MISVIIPTLNAAAALRRNLPPLIEGAARGLVREVIITDGASEDDIVDLAAEYGARFVTGQRGRGSQLARGGAIARGPWLLFLHADSILPEGWVEAVRDFIDGPDTMPRAAYFRLTLDAPGLMPQLVAWGANTRSRIFALPYGDQGFVIRKDLYDTLGGYAKIPLFEDVDLVRRVVKYERINASDTSKPLYELPLRITTSATRYRAHGYLRRVIRNFYCLCLYFLGYPPAKILTRYQHLPINNLSIDYVSEKNSSRKSPPQNS